MRLSAFAIVVAGLLVAIGAVPACADFSPVLVDVVSTPDGYLWTYSVIVPQGWTMLGFGGVPGPGTLPQDDDVDPEEKTCPCQKIKDYLTIYDFSGFRNVVQFSVPGFDWRSYSLGSTPADAIVEENAAPNVTVFQANQGTVHGGDGFFFALLSSEGGPPHCNSYSAEITARAIGDTSFGFPGPGQANEVPEPGTLSLVAVGLLGVGMYRHQKKA